MRIISFCTTNDVRLITGLSTDDISDDNLNSIISLARKKVMQDVSSEVTDEQVNIIDSYRENTIDGSNTTFFVRKSWDWFLFDRDGDGNFDENDIKVYSYDADTDGRTELTVSSVDERGSYVLDSAPATSSSDVITTSYRYSRVSVDNTTLVQACAFLSAAYAFTRLRADEADSVSFGALKAMFRGKTFDYYFKSYEVLIDSLKKLPKKVRG